jgi:hypothetical protein
MKLEVVLPDDLAERLKRAAYWMPGVTEVDIVCEGIAMELDALDPDGKGYPPIPQRKAKALSKVVPRDGKHWHTSCFDEIDGTRNRTKAARKEKA